MALHHGQMTPSNVRFLDTRLRSHRDVVIQITVNPGEVATSGPCREGTFMAEPMTCRDRSAGVTRREMLAAGREIYSQQPYSEVRGLQISNQECVSRGALHHHFGSKLGPFMAVFQGLQIVAPRCAAPGSSRILTRSCAPRTPCCGTRLEYGGRATSLWWPHCQHGRQP